MSKNNTGPGVPKALFKIGPKVSLWLLGSALLGVYTEVHFLIGLVR